MNRQILVSASLFHALNDAAVAIVPMTFPLLYSQKILVSSYAHIGILSHVGLLVTLVFQIVIAQAAERYEYRNLLAGSVAGLSLSLFLLTTADTFLSLLAFYGLFRMFSSFYHPLGIAWVSRTHPSRTIDAAMGIQAGSGNLGVVLAFLLAGHLLQKARWETPVLFWAVIVLGLGGLSYAAVRRVSTRSREVFFPTFSHWMRTLRSMRMYVPGIVFEGAGWAMIVYYAPSLFNHRFRVPLGRTGLYLALWIGVGTAVTYLFGFISRRVGRLRLTLLGCLGSGFAFALLGVAGRFEMAVLGLLLLGVFLFLLYPAFQSFVGNRVVPQDQALAFSLVANIQVLAGALVTLGAGFLADRLGLAASFLVMAGVGIFVGLIYAAVARKEKSAGLRPGT